MESTGLTGGRLLRPLTPGLRRVRTPECFCVDGREWRRGSSRPTPDGALGYDSLLDPVSGRWPARSACTGPGCAMVPRTAHSGGGPSSLNAGWLGSRVVMGVSRPDGRSMRPCAAVGLCARVCVQLMFGLTGCDRAGNKNNKNNNGDSDNNDNSNKQHTHIRTPAQCKGRCFRA